MKTFNEFNGINLDVLVNIITYDKQRSESDFSINEDKIEAMYDNGLMNLSGDVYKAFGEYFDDDSSNNIDHQRLANLNSLSCVETLVNDEIDITAIDFIAFDCSKHFKMQLFNMNTSVSQFRCILLSNPSKLDNILTFMSLIRHIDKHVSRFSKLIDLNESIETLGESFFEASFYILSEVAANNNIDSDLLNDVFDTYDPFSIDLSRYNVSNRLRALQQ